MRPSYLDVGFHCGFHCVQAIISLVVLHSILGHAGRLSRVVNRRLPTHTHADRVSHEANITISILLT